MDFYPYMDRERIPERFGELPVACEYAYDMDTAQFKFKNGKMYKVYEKEALKIKLWKLFMTELYKWVVFPWDYGHELESLIGKAYTQGYVNSEAERYVKEAIDRALGEYITRLDDFRVTFEEGLLIVAFTAVSIYGDIVMDGLPLSLT